MATEKEPIGEEFLVDDYGSPHGPRGNVPARLNSEGLFILGEDGRWYLVTPVDWRRNIIGQMLALMGIRNGTF